MWNKFSDKQPRDNQDIIAIGTYCTNCRGHLYRGKYLETSQSVKINLSTYSKDEIGEIKHADNFDLWTDAEMVERVF